MAEVRLDKTEFKLDGDLPPVCIVCGDGSDRTTRQTFEWSPRASGILRRAWNLISGPSGRKVDAFVPVCPAHVGYFWQRKLLIMLPVYAGMLGAIAGMLAMGSAGPGSRISYNLGGFAVLFGGFGLLAALVASEVLSRMGVRPVEITDDHVRLSGVSDSFAQAVAGGRVD